MGMTYTNCLYIIMVCQPGAATSNSGSHAMNMIFARVGKLRRSVCM